MHTHCQAILEESEHFVNELSHKMHASSLSLQKVNFFKKKSWISRSVSTFVFQNRYGASLDL